MKQEMEIDLEEEIEKMKQESVVNNDEDMY